MAYEYVRKVMVVPINCPYCDEPAYPKDKTQRVVMDHAIFTHRKCIMGHEFWSKEEVPEDQNQVEEHLKKFRKKKWREYMRSYRATDEYQKKAAAKREKWKLYRDAEKRAKKTANETNFLRNNNLKQGEATKVKRDIEQWDEGDCVDNMNE